MQVNEFVKALEQEKEGFSLGFPWRYDKDSITCVVPILRDCEDSPTYLVSVKVRNVVIKDTGGISPVLITNNEKLPVFFRLGELLKGDTQERALVMSRVIMPGETAKVEVVCVHASKGIVMGAEFKPDGYTPGRDASYTTALFTHQQVNQGSSWEQDKAYVHAVMCSATSRGLSGETSEVLFRSPGSGADNLKQVRDSAQKIFKDILKDVPLFESQVGMVLIDAGGLHSLDCFDLAASWKEVKEALTGKESAQISKKDESGVFNYDPDKAKDTIAGVLGKSWEEKVLMDMPETKTVVLDTDGFSGEAVLLGDMVIHLLLARK